MIPHCTDKIIETAVVYFTHALFNSSKGFTASTHPFSASLNRLLRELGSQPCSNSFSPPCRQHTCRHSPSSNLDLKAYQKYGYCRLFFHCFNNQLKYNSEIGASDISPTRCFAIGGAFTAFTFKVWGWLTLNKYPFSWSIHRLPSILVFTWCTHRNLQCCWGWVHRNIASGDTQLPWVTCHLVAKLTRLILASISPLSLMIKSSSDNSNRYCERTRDPLSPVLVAYVWGYRNALRYHWGLLELSMWVCATVSMELGYWSSTTQTRISFQLSGAQDKGSCKWTHPSLESSLHLSGICKTCIFPGTPQSNSIALYLLGLLSLCVRVGTELTMLNMHAAIRICTQACILNVSLKTDVNMVHP